MLAWSGPWASCLEALLGPNGKETGLVRPPPPHTKRISMTLPLFAATRRAMMTGTLMALSLVAMPGRALRSKPPRCRKPCCNPAPWGTRCWERRMRR